jgi:hypothetical protein
VDSKSVPDGAITTNMTSKFFVQKWEIETLANELMTVPKAKLVKNGATRTLRRDSFQVALQCVNWLRKLENVEYRIYKREDEIFTEMGRIAARQFDWQRGYLNIPQFYRNAFVYGQGECAEYFQKKRGMTINRFSEIGFLLFVYFTHFPIVRDDASWAQFGVKWDEIEHVLKIIALPFSEAAKLARAERASVLHTAHKPSVLRRSPCLRFGESGERIRSPLPELILERVTSGVFYDVVDGGGAIQNDYGKRFEEYCARYLVETLRGFEWEREFRYRKKSDMVRTPDVICSEMGKIIFVFECKATRMSQEAMFGRNPIEARGYHELSYGVFQLWRFFSHCRRGFVAREIAEEAVGVVLTLDNWLIVSETLRERVLEEATKMAHDKDREIMKFDRKPIVFVAVPELERTLTAATEKTFREALLQANSKKFKGWRLDSILREILEGEQIEERRYPYAADLGALLPWWDEMDRFDQK